MAQQCDQIWQFLIVFGDVPIFLGTKVAQIFGDILGYNETRIILNKPAVTTFWTIFWKNKNWTTFSTFGHTYERSHIPIHDYYSVKGQTNSHFQLRKNDHSYHHLFSVFSNDSTAILTTNYLSSSSH